MARWRWLPPALLGIGLVVLAAAAGFLLLARFGEAEGMQDLARFVGALLLTAVAGVPLAGYLLALRLPGARRPASWTLAVAALGAIVAALAAGALLLTAVESGNVWLAVVMTGVLAFAISGLGSGATIARRAA